MLKPGELLMQLHHFADHQQGRHGGVFRQVFELLQCAGYRLLIVAAAFAGQASLARHRQVHKALGDLLPSRIHALSIKALAPEEALASASPAS